MRPFDTVAARRETFLFGGLPDFHDSIAKENPEPLFTRARNLKAFAKSEISKPT
jgi:hypothetical protein